MVFIAAYDIADGRRLKRVAKIMERFGIRIQYSIFRCSLNNDELERMKRCLNRTIDKEEDSIVIIPVAEDDWKKHLEMGKELAKDPADETCIFL